VAGHVPGAGEGTRTREKTRNEIQHPPLYKVLIHNDNYTTMDFVVQILQSVFHKRHEDSVRIMFAVHRKGVGLCGVYTAQVAETKVAVVHKHAQDQGFPLRCSMEPA